MKTLLILRHGEAAPAGPDRPDVHRPLTEGGRTQARLQGMRLRERGIDPERIVCSAAVRARETAETVTAAAGWSAAVTPFEHLYNASGEELLAQASSQADEVNHLILVAHVPGVANLLSLLTTEHVDLALIYNPATLAEVVLDIDHWSEIDYGTGSLRLLLPP